MFRRLSTHEHLKIANVRGQSIICYHASAILQLPASGHAKLNSLRFHKLLERYVDAHAPFSEFAGKSCVKMRSGAFKANREIGLDSVIFIEEEDGISWDEAEYCRSPI